MNSREWSVLKQGTALELWCWWCNGYTALPGRADLSAFHIFFSELSPLSAGAPTLIHTYKQVLRSSDRHTATCQTHMHTKIPRRPPKSQQQNKWFRSYRVHSLLGLQRFGMLYGLHFLLVLSQHPATKACRLFSLPHAHRSVSLLNLINNSTKELTYQLRSVFPSSNTSFHWSRVSEGNDLHQVCWNRGNLHVQCWGMGPKKKIKNLWFR